MYDNFCLLTLSAAFNGFDTLNVPVGMLEMCFFLHLFFKSKSKENAIT